ncbi:MAG: cytochrome c oxidase subunit II [Acidobacteriota bacterium]|nr:cytochrome c oxidase subunit II [Acidobacteriota bacterium]
MKFGFPLFPESASTLAPQVDAIYFFGLGVAAFFSTLIACLIFYLAIRYRRRSEDEVGKREKAAMWLEIAWSIIPLGILLFMFAWGAKVYFEARRPPGDAVEYFVTGKQWMWKFQHPEGQREINHLHVPVGQPIQLKMTSEDVIHSFFVPAFRIKMDVLPGRYTTVWFEATKTGTFRLFCAEYCGAEHSRMGGSITVMEPRDYEQWLARADSATGPLALAGAQLFEAKTCGTCHRPDSNLLAPILHGLFGEEVTLASGDKVLVDENYLRESILDPKATVVSGYEAKAVMPTFVGQLSEEELVELISYIKSLGDAASHGETPEESAG